jgi:hypothetical protein
MTRIRLIVGLITSHRTYQTITKTREGRQRPDPGCSGTDDYDDDDDVIRGRKKRSRTRLFFS